jgi:hypothetical protein
MKLDVIDGTIHVPTDAFNPHFVLRMSTCFFMDLELNFGIHPWLNPLFFLDMPFTFGMNFGPNVFP